MSSDVGITEGLRSLRNTEGEGGGGGGDPIIASGGSDPIIASGGGDPIIASGTVRVTLDIE